MPDKNLSFGGVYCYSADDKLLNEVQKETKKHVSILLQQVKFSAHTHSH